MNMKYKYSADRHSISVEKKIAWFVPSHTGRDLFLLSSFYPDIIPNGMLAKIISENFKELAI